MDALTKGLTIMALVALVTCPIALSVDADAEGEASGLLLYQVAFLSSDVKGVAVHNYGSTDVDMRDYKISDTPAFTNNEGMIEFSETIIVKPGETLVIAEKYIEGSKFASQANVVFFGEGNTDGVIEKGDFNPNGSKGDDIYLLNAKSEIIDCVIYKSGEADEEYWTGKGVYTRGDNWIQRHNGIDTNTFNDWFVYVEGQSSFEFDPDLKIDAIVTPFLFPDHGGIPIYRALESAQENVVIEMYQLISWNVYGLLIELAERGVEIDILLEGSSLDGGNYDPILDQSKPLARLIELGADIRLIGMGEENRYRYDHAKFALIDGDTTIICSENWTPSNMNGEIDDKPYVGSNDGNRGWGVIIESTQYYDYMYEVFESDRDTSYGDVKYLMDVYPNIVSGDVYYESPTYTGEFESFEAKVTPIVSTDNAYEALMYYVSNTEERLYTEQQSFSEGYDNLTPSSPIHMFIEKADAGVDTKVLFKEDKDRIDNLVNEINATTAIEAGVFSKLNLHNKGLICDDIVWVSSINWTWGSFHHNREVCVAIDSAEVADYFAKSFLNDFEQYYDYDGFKVAITEVKTNTDRNEVAITVDVKPEGNYTYTWTWEIDGVIESKTTDIPRAVIGPFDKDGTYEVTITVTDENGLRQERTTSFTIGEGADDPSPSKDFELPAIIEDNLYIIAPIVVVILGAIVAAMRHR